MCRHAYCLAITTNGNSTMESSANHHSLETADAVARATHLWVRSLCLNEKQDAGDRLALAGGLVAGLCQRLSLDHRVQELVAYVYALLDEEGNQALAVSRMMLDQPVPPAKLLAYQRGRSEAAGIIEMLAYHDN